jgi:hypothetical protein
MVARMGIFTPPSTAYVPPLPSLPPLPDPPPQMADKAIGDAALDARARARASAGYGSTIATSPQGVLAPPAIGFKTLLGQ